MTEDTECGWAWDAIAEAWRLVRRWNAPPVTENIAIVYRRKDQWLAVMDREAGRSPVPCPTMGYAMVLCEQHNGLITVGIKAPREDASLERRIGDLEEVLRQLDKRTRSSDAGEDRPLWSVNLSAAPRNVWLLGRIEAGKETGKVVMHERPVIRNLLGHGWRVMGITGDVGALPKGLVAWRRFEGPAY